MSDMIICGLDEPHSIPGPTCPNVAQHEPQPKGFAPSYEWALRKMLTHHQPHACPGCGRWFIWAEGPTVFDEDGLTREDVLEMLGESPEDEQPTDTDWDETDTDEDEDEGR